MNETETHHIDELTEFELDVNFKCISDIDDRSDQFIVVAQKIIVEPLGIRIPSRDFNGKHREYACYHTNTFR